MNKENTSNPEEQTLKHKKTREAAKRKTFFQKKIKQKSTEWGIVDVYRFITLQQLAKLLDKPLGGHLFFYPNALIKRSYIFSLRK